MIGYLLFLAFLKSVGVPMVFLVFLAMLVGFALVDTFSSSTATPPPKPAPRPWRQAVAEDWKMSAYIFGSLAIVALMIVSREGFWPTLAVGTALGVLPAFLMRPTEGFSRPFAAVAFGICGAFYVVVFYGFRVVAVAFAAAK